jgi:hypothetical protein
VKVFLMRPDVGGQYLICERIEDVGEMLFESSGNTFEVKCVDMTEEQLANAGDFDGW